MVRACQRPEQPAGTPIMDDTLTSIPDDHGLDRRADDREPSMLTPVLIGLAALTLILLGLQSAAELSRPTGGAIDRSAPMLNRAG